MEAASGRARPRRPGTAGDGQSGGGGGRRRVAGEEHPPHTHSVRTATNGGCNWPYPLMDGC